MKHRPLITFYILSKLVPSYISIKSAPSFWTELLYTNKNQLIALYFTWLKIFQVSFLPEPNTHFLYL